MIALSQKVGEINILKHSFPLGTKCQEQHMKVDICIHPSQ